ncbi:MAG: MFS transporter [Candidatus Margulisiibacteriota bacterium]|jgi:maltose/moltooligosaccharide transporter
MQKPNLSFWQIWNLSFGFFGIQFGWGLQMANMSAIYEFLGAKPEVIPILWLAGPVTGLIIQPIIGKWSDKTWGPLGRRKPFFLGGAILASLALILMPNSTALWMAAGLLWILDASVNVSMGPFRAIVADKLNDQQMTLGYSIQSVLIALGSVIASALPFILTTFFGFSLIAKSGHIPLAVKLSFYVGAAVFMFCILWTVFTTKEYPPEKVDAVNQPPAKGFIASIPEFITDLFHMPKTMWQLALVQIFAWMGLFCMFIYFPVAIAHHVFAGTEGTLAYLHGIEWAGICFALYSVVCFLVSMAMPFLTTIFPRKFTYSLCLLLGGLGLISVLFIHNKYMLIIPMIGIGVMYASLMIIPYAILADVLPSLKRGFYMGLFNLFIVIPEILIALCFGLIVFYFLGNSRLLALAAGGVFMIIAALLALRINDVKHEN